MDEFLDKMKNQFNLEELKLVGYHGGYPIIEFRKKDNMKLLSMSKFELSNVIRKCETSGGIELGVAWNFVKTAYVNVNGDKVVLAGHEFVLKRLLEKLV